MVVRGICSRLVPLLVECDRWGIACCVGSAFEGVSGCFCCNNLYLRGISSSRSKDITMYVYLNPKTKKLCPAFIVVTEVLPAVVPPPPHHEQRAPCFSE